MKNILKQSGIYGLLVLFLASAVISFFPQSASAATYQEDGVEKRAEVWVLSAASWLCIDHGAFLDTLSEDDVKAGDWQNADNLSPQVGEYTGGLAEGGDSDDDKVECDKVFKTLANRLGVSMESFICGLGIYGRAEGGEDHCSDGAGNYVVKDEYYDIQSDKSKEVLLNYLQNGYFGGLSLESSVSDAMKYIIFFKNFYGHCGNGKWGKGFTVKPWSNQDVSSQNSLRLPWYEDNQVKDSFVVSDDLSGSSGVDGSEFLPDGENGGSDSKLGCESELPNLIKKYAPAMEAAITAANSGEAPSVSTDPTAAGSGDIDLDCGGSNIWAKIANPLNWLTCSVLGGMSRVTKSLDSAINDMLCVNENSIFGGGTSTCDSGGGNSSTSDGYKKAWDTFRIISLGLLAITGLLMVLSQTIGLEIFDAYSIRKTLPRLLVAAIGVTLSWQLMEFFVGLSNALGIGMRSLIYTPFNSSGLNEVVIGGGAKAVGTILEVGAIGILGPLGILSFVATGLLAVLVAFFVLVIRNIVVILLIILAPVAIVAYALPNSEKAWRIWWDGFSKALLMFPIITAFIAVGHVFAAIASKQGGTISSFVAVIAYFAPYFLLPMTFRLAGGAIATIGGMANDRGRGAFDRLKGFRGARAKDRFARAQNKSLYDPSTKLGRAGNQIATWASDPLSNAAYQVGKTKYGSKIPGLAKSSASIASSIEHQGVEQSGKLFEEINKMGYNDKAFRALSGAYTDANGKGLFKPETLKKMEAAKFITLGADGETIEKVHKTPKSLADIQKMGHILSQSSGETERIAGNAMEASAGRLATLYQDPEMGRANVNAAGIMGLSQHGFADGEDLAQVGNLLVDGKTENAGFAQAVLTQSQLMGMRSRPDIKPGYGITVKDGKFVDGMSVEGGRAEEVLKTLSSQDLAGAKGGAIKKLRPTIEKIIARGDNNSIAQKEQLFQWAGQYSQASVDVKAEALEMISKFGLQEEFEAVGRMSPEQLEAMRKAGIDPSADQNQGN